MAIRKIVKIDDTLCTGCGDCVTACAEAAIEIVDGKARMVSEVYCDGLGACLGECPEGAITIEEREAQLFDEHAVARRLNQLTQSAPPQCPSVLARDLGAAAAAGALAGPSSAVPAQPAHRLRNWPIQLALVRPDAPFLVGADLVLAADCTAFARPGVLTESASGRPVLIACPKLDETGPYLEKLVDLFRVARPRAVTVVRMVVPCCGGLSYLARQALEIAGSDLPITEITVGIEGEIEATTTLPSSPRAASS